jgi:transcription elongation factor Elf1
MAKDIKKRMIRRAIKKREHDREKTMEALECNVATASKSIVYRTEAQRKRMAANFYRGGV